MPEQALSTEKKLAVSTHASISRTVDGHVTSETVRAIIRRARDLKIFNNRQMRFTARTM